MEMLLEVVEHGLNLWPAPQQFQLALGHELFPLLVVRWCQDACTKGFAYLALQGLAAVARVADSDFGVLVDEHRYGS